MVALCVDWEAMSIECAETWVWLYVLLAVVIPTSFGFVMGGVKAGLALADLKKNVGWEIPDVLLALPGPIIYITLGILGIILWAGMSEECAAEYSSEYSMLFVVFKIQVLHRGWQQCQEFDGCAALLLALGYKHSAFCIWLLYACAV